MSRIEQKETARVAEQAGREENQSYVTIDFLVDVIAKLTEIAPRYKRLLKSDKDTLRYFLKKNLGLDLNDIQLGKDIDSGFYT